MAACGSNASTYQRKKVVTCRRIWTKPEEDVLVQSLKEIISTGWKADNGFRVGYLNVLQDKIMRAFLRTDLRVNSHISSKMHSWKKQYNSLYTIFGGTGVKWNPTTKMIDTVVDAAWKTTCKVFGKDRANGTRDEDFHDVLNGVLHNESQPQTPLGPNLEDMDTSYTPGVEEVGTTSFCQSGSSSTSKQPKKGKRKKDEGIIGSIMEGINKFTDKTDSRLGEIVSKMGHEYELTRKCEAVFDIVNQNFDLTLDEKLVATNMIVKNTQVLAMFFSLPENAKVGQAMDGQVPQGDGWTVHKEIFFIDLMNEARGRNEITNGQMGDNVVVQRVSMGPEEELDQCSKIEMESKYEFRGEVNWEKFREVFDDDLGDGEVDHPDNTHGRGYQSENVPTIVPNPNYLEYLICMYFKYDLE
ncbi:hypothetical protein BUALT_Bualt02G0056000 [Buddleja alternifolia]|uniref:Myb/SANT-like domain-containing protein n=1 Tax=Buddleja alternifolia TaxID=168488 RepID=A0AAV6Y5P1_9LAMI|nr:hypothetical protein BUALT_Bualt02G0056000 [Buddleja alternifolia]